MTLDDGHGADRALSLDEVADLLNVSPAYVIGLLQRGEIPFRDSGGRPQVTMTDALAFRRRDAAERRCVLDELTSEAEKHRLGY
jgi:excisionase family DNA binding protein